MASNNNEIDGIAPTATDGLAAARPVNILTSDILVADELITLPSANDLATTPANLRERYARLEVLLNEMLAKKGLKSGDKISIDAEEYRTLSEAVAGLPSKTEAGGSTADILTTVKHLLGDKTNIDYIGIAGVEDVNDNLIAEDFHRNGIRLDPGATPGAKAAMSFIFTHPDGKRSTITYPGNAAEKLSSSLVTDAKIAQSDAVFIPISLWAKFDASLPEALFKKSLEQDKKIIVSIPKQARFGYGGPENIHKWVIPRADVIVADEEELARLYKTTGNPELTIKNLEADLAKHDRLRSESGKAPRTTPATAFIKHKDNSATVLVAGLSDDLRRNSVTRYEIAAPAGEKQHTLGLDDAMYAGFIAATSSGMEPAKAAEFALNVAGTKSLYSTVRIPSPVGADQATQQQWTNLQSSLSDKLAGLGSAFTYAITGVQNKVDQHAPRTPGQKGFDFFLYPFLANISVWVLSMIVTYHSNFNQNKENFFVKRSSWWKDQLAKIPGLGKSPEMVRNLNMVIWSFVDGTIMAPVVAAFEARRQKISRWIDDKLGTTPDDKSVYAKEVQRSWKDILKARGTTFAFVIATYFALNAKVFPGSTHQGILNETPPNSGTFTRETVKSINGFVFDIPAKFFGEGLMKLKSVGNLAHKISGKQLTKMAHKTGAPIRPANANDARYQVEGLVNTGLFELVYTSLCTAGLFFIGKIFASKRTQAADKASADSTTASTYPTDGGAQNTYADVSTERASSSRAEKITPRQRPQKSGSYTESADKDRNAVTQLG